MHEKELAQLRIKRYVLENKLKKNPLFLRLLELEAEDKKLDEELKRLDEIEINRIYLKLKKKEDDEKNH